MDERIIIQVSKYLSLLQRSTAVFNKLLRSSRLLNRRQKGSLLRRFQLLLLLWGFAVYIIAVSGFWFFSTSVIETTLSHQTSQWINKIDSLSVPLFRAQEGSELAAIEEYMGSINELAYASFYPSDVTIMLASYSSDQFDVSQIPDFSAATLKSIKDQPAGAGAGAGARVADRRLGDQDIVRIAWPVADNSGVVLGYVDIGVDYSFYRQSLVDNILKGSLYIFLCFLAALLLGRMVIKNALRPLLDLREPLEKLARGDTDVWVNKEGGAEIVAISNALSTTISAIKGRDAELRRLADFDSLTGLFNKRSFNVLFEKECRRISSESDPGALFFIDLDQFKYVNDSLGHAAGDRLLIEVAGLLKQRLRAKDVVSRLGGDEFAVLAKSVSRHGAVELANAIVREVSDFLFVEEGKTFNLGCSIGVALITDDQYSPEDVFAQADMACYSAKSQGRNRYHLYEPALADKNKMDIGWSQRITRALSEDNFELHFQPIINASNRHTDAYEVLLRLLDDDGAYVLPGLFMSVAERFGLAAEIDCWVISRAMALLEKEAALENYPRLHVNLSTQILSSPDFLERVLTLSEGFEFNPGQIVFEITEQAAVMNINHSVSLMNKLKAQGFRLAIDKFGSGFNSFSYLRHMPVDYVKVSGEFVERMLEDGVDRAMVKSIVDVARACDKQVIAEYVAGHSSLDILQGFGVDYMQGNFIAEPQRELVCAVVEPLLAQTNLAELHRG